MPRRCRRLRAAGPLPRGDPGPADPAHRGRGIASRLLDAALAHASDIGVGTVRLSVWEWRTGAVALYERFGFAVTESWDERAQLVCMERAV